MKFLEFLKGCCSSSSVETRSFDRPEEKEQAAKATKGKTITVKGRLPDLTHHVEREVLHTGAAQHYTFIDAGKKPTRAAFQEPAPATSSKTGVTPASDPSLVRIR